MKWGFATGKAKQPAPVRPVLDLSGPRLRRAFDDLAVSAEPTGGVERYVGALALKASLFGELLSNGRAATIDEKQFGDLACFVAPVRRRIGPWLEPSRFRYLRQWVESLLEDDGGPETADARIAGFVARFPADREHRWTRDLAAEILHFTAPDVYPLMTRWMWDHRVGSGVLREIWHADDIDAALIAVDDGFAMHETLRDELGGFLKENGVYRDMPLFVDLLCAHVYAGYINDRGGQYLRPDFCGERGDGMVHTRRMLGLDAVDTETGRTRLKLVDGRAHVLSETLKLNS